MSDVKMSKAERLAQWLEDNYSQCHDEDDHEMEAAAELRRLAAVEAAYDGKAHELVVLEDAYDLLTDARDRLIEERDDLLADRDRLAAEVEALRADAERLDSGCILTQECDEFGEPYQRITTGIDLRAAIDAAKAKEGK